MAKGRTELKKWADDKIIQRQQELEKLELVVENHVDAFLESGKAVAEALSAIKAQKLWLCTHASWEQYLAVRWNGRLSKRKADRAIASFLTSERVGASKQLPTRAVVNLNTLPKTNDQIAAYDRAAKAAHAAGQSEPTATQITEAVEEVKATPLPTKPTPIDDIRRGAADFKAICNEINALNRKIEGLADSDWGAELVTEIPAIRGSLNAAKNTVRLAAPHCLCVYCKAGCKACRSRKPRWISYAMYRNASKQQQDGINEHA